MRSWLGRIVRRLFFRLVASLFVAGRTPEEALPRIERLNRRGFFVTVDLLGEDVTDRAQARAASHSYIQLLEQLDAAKLRDTNISVKLTMLGLFIDEGLCRENLEQLLVRAKQLDAFVRVDMENPNIKIGPNEESLTEVTLRIVSSLLPTYRNHVGVVLQAYLGRTQEDAEAFTHRNTRVRLCKGAYRTKEGVALEERDAIRRNYQRTATYLLNYARRPAFATHDTYLIDWILEHGRGSTSFEFQMLYGIRTPLAEKLLAGGSFVRIYVPVGESWLPYFRRRLAEGKPRQLLWMFIRNLRKH